MELKFEEFAYVPLYHPSLKISRQNNRFLVSKPKGHCIVHVILVSKLVDLDSGQTKLNT